MEALAASPRRWQSRSPRAAPRRRVTAKRPAAVEPHVAALPARVLEADGALRTLVINLDRRQDRWEALLARLAPLVASGCLRPERFSATDGLRGGDEMPESAVGVEWTTDRNAKYDGRAGARRGVKLKLSAGERGCAMSHVRAWRAVAEASSGASATGAAGPPTLILEDDAVPSGLFAAMLAPMLQAAEADGADALYLGYIQGAPWRRKVAKGLHEAEYLWTTVAYILWPRGARRLLASLPVDQPVDNFMGWLAASRRLHSLAVVPELVEQAEEWDQGSDVPHSDDVVLA